MLRTALVVEDDRDIVELIAIHLADLSCTVEPAYYGQEGLEKALDNTYDIILLDVMLPGVQGTETVRRIRQAGILTPVLMLSAKSEEVDKVLGLELGADDYVTKPFSIREFKARVKAIFRRVEHGRRGHDAGSEATVLHRGAMTIDLDKHRVTLGGDRVDLSPKEFELLALLAAEPGKCYDRSKILKLVWGYDFDGYEHTVNSHISRLRTKIEPDLQHPTYIITNWGIGYRFNEAL